VRSVVKTGTRQGLAAYQAMQKALAPIALYSSRIE